MGFFTSGLFLALLSLAGTSIAQCTTGKTTGGSFGRKYGPYVSIGGTKNQIIRMETLYTPGKKPPRSKGVLFLWPGMNDQANKGSDLIQTVIEAPGNCGAEQWCLAPVVMHGYSVADWDKRLAIAPDSPINITYSRKDKNWVQTTTVVKSGKQLHEYVRGTGALKGWGTGTEVQSGHPGTVDTQYYEQTIIELASPDPGFAKTHTITGTGKSKAISTPVKTTDNKVFTIEKITLPPWSNC
ncbi:Sexual differentiation process protein isp4 [Venturia nashicola]|nr:Sexual differentiation process protein isp4 [Venturia nashicola]